MHKDYQLCLPSDTCCGLTERGTTADDDGWGTKLAGNEHRLRRARNKRERARKIRANGSSAIKSECCVNVYRTLTLCVYSFSFTRQ